MPDNAEAAIRRLIERYARSVDDADTVLAAEIWATTRPVSFIHPRGQEHGWDDIRDRFYTGLMGGTFSHRTLEVRDPVVHVHGGAAWSEFHWEFEATVRADGSTLKTAGRETQLYWELDGQWRLVHVHYSGPPVTADLEGF